MIIITMNILLIIITIIIIIIIVWHCLSNATCLIRPHSFFACLVYNLPGVNEAPLVRRFRRNHALDKQC